jgi:H+/Cl- antiporter ClcA
MLRRQARPCTNLSWLYRRFGVVIFVGLFGASFGVFVLQLIPRIREGFSSDLFQGIMGECLVPLCG